MKLFRDFPTTVVKAVSSPAFYKDVIKGKIGGGFGYFLLLTFLLAAIETALISVAIIPSTEILLAKIRENIVDIFPADLEIKIDKGQVSTNVAQPYKIPFSQFQRLLPQATTDLSPEFPTEENFLVIDSKAKVEDFPKYKTSLLLISSGIVIPEPDNGFRYYPMSKDTSLTIDRRMVRMAWSRISPLTQWLAPGIVGVIFVLMIFFFPVWHLVYLIFGALLLLLFARLVAIRLSFKAAYRVGLYAITLPLLVELVVSLLLPGVSIPFYFTVIFLIFSQIMLRRSAS